MNNTLKKILDILKWSFLSFFSLLFLYFFFAFLLSYLPTNPTKVSCSQKEEIFITSNGVHLGIILPNSTLSKDFKDKFSIKVGNYTDFGWGDKGFYLETPTWDDLKYSTAIEALFWYSPSVLHIENYQNIQSHWKKLEVCPSQIALLEEYIEKSIQKDSSGRYKIIVGESYGLNDKFYEANGSYNCFITCNVWVNQALKNAQIKTSIWSPFDFGVLYHIPK